MVNLGWVPVENKKEIEMTNEPLGTFEPEEGQMLDTVDNYTGIIKILRFNRIQENHLRIR